MSSKNQTKVTVEPGKQELFITREFEASRMLVFKAFTDPAYYVRWIGPKELKMKADKVARKAGEPWRDIYTDPAGNTIGFHGVCHEYNAPARLIRTFEFEGLPETGHVSLETATFEELPGERTKVMIHTVFKSVADRDGMVQARMEQGVTESYERLDDLFASNEVH